MKAVISSVSAGYSNSLEHCGAPLKFSNSWQKWCLGLDPQISDRPGECALKGSLVLHGECPVVGDFPT